MKTITYNVRFSRFMLYALCFPLFAANPTPTNDPPAEASNIIYQSTDGGQTWQDISNGLPENEQPEDFFAGESGLYLKVKNVMYRSKSNLKTPVWEKTNVPDSESASIAFNRSSVTAFNYAGKIYQHVSSEGTWLPVLTNLNKHSVRGIFETSDGTLLLGCDSGLYRSADKGKSWRQVQNEGWVMEFVESEGVLIATGQGGIMRSTDNGENWQWVIREGGVGIAIERINGGFAAISCNTRTESRRIHTSFDKGKTWTAISDDLPPTLFITSVKQVGKYLLCGHPDGIFRSSDMGKTWSYVHPSVDKVFKVSYARNVGRVFTLHVSGNVVYAVAGSAGC